ncbi:MAG TPA: long-chain fatty acid--CoA ligase [Anaerolineales bacterium]|nr:long-chain fatty acid--CoA ligase [Anaerolineae bacterium]HIQ00899.1 long-chain fatty acid--CoA ligase [Anaerolineales bacterium]
MERPWQERYDAGVPSEIEIPDVPFTAFFDRAVAEYPENVATYFYGGRLTYRQLGRLSTRFANGLIGLGVRPGDRVALHLPNCPQFVIAYFGAWKAGAVVTPVSPLLAPREVAHQINDAGAETLVTLPRFYPTVQEIRGDTSLRRVIVTPIKGYMGRAARWLYALFRERGEGDRTPVEAGDYRWMDLVRRADARPPGVTVGPDDLALLQYTGGTTGIPKGAMLTHRNLVANIMQAHAWIQPVLTTGQESILSVLPFFHLYGIAACLHLGVLLASTMILLPRFDLEEVLGTIHRLRPTLFPGVPTMYVAVNHYPQLDRYDLSSLKFCLSGAAPLPLEVQQRFEQISGCRMVQGYGMTEASPVTHLTLLVGETPLRSTGLPVPGTEARIVDLETGERTLPPGEEGEIVVRGPQVMKGYWRMPTETANALRGGWLYTGDIGYMDEQGFFYVVDRKKDVIISGGAKVFPRDVEEVLYAHPGVKEVAVVGVPDPYWGEVVKAYVVPRDGVTLEAEEIVQFCRERLARYKVPKAVELRGELPKTLVGKVLRRTLREEEARHATDHTHTEVER